MDEKHVEHALIKATKKRGGMAIKLTCPGMAGMPDRMIILRGGHIGFIEVKKPGGKPRQLQEHRLDLLRSYGFYAITIDHPTQIEDALNAIQTA